MALTRFRRPEHLGEVTVSRRAGHLSQQVASWRDVKRGQEQRESRDNRNSSYGWASDVFQPIRRSP